MAIVSATNDRALVSSLRSALCPACGERKKPGQTLCRLCYIALPRPARVRLYDRLGAGYREAVTHAMTLLGKTEFLSRPE